MIDFFYKAGMFISALGMLYALCRYYTEIPEVARMLVVGIIVALLAKCGINVRTTAVDDAPPKKIDGEMPR